MYSPSGHEDVDEIVSSLEQIWWNVALNIALNYLWIIVMYLSAVWTLILTAPIHCRGSIGEQVMEC